MYKVVEFKEEDNYINDFLEFPKTLYDKGTITQNKEEERLILLNKHILSKYFKIHKYLVYKENQVVARCILTIYPNDKALYFGFFESINNKEVVKSLFKYIDKYAKDNGFNKIVGPYDCSFWIKYRLKSNYFERKPYFGEPYNKDYYLDLLQNTGLEVCETYVSNSFKKFPIVDILFNKKQKEKYTKRYSDFSSRNYKIKRPKKSEFDKVMTEVYEIIMETYSDFPVFKNISNKDFKEHFNSFKDIIDFSIVRMAYYEGQAVGFLLGYPDYGNLFFKETNISTYLKVFFSKIRSKRYVYLYMGVKKEHRGLGKAIVKSSLKNLFIRRSASIIALTKEGRKNKEYGQEFIESIYEYVLLEKRIGK